MVFPGNFIKVQFGGALYKGAEIWSCSLSMAGPDGGQGGTPVDLKPFADVFAAWWRRPGSLIGGEATLEFLKMNRVGPDGRYVSSTSTISYDYPTPPAGTSGAGFPAQCTMAYTLMGSVRRGPGALGRFYPPAPGVAIGADGRVPKSYIDDMVVSGTQLLNDLNSVPNQNLIVVNASESGPGAFSPVTRLRIGRVVDTQRRRRSALNEDPVLGEALNLTGGGDPGEAQPVG